MTQQREKRAYRKCLVATFQYIKVYRVPVLKIAEEGDDAVNRYEQKDADDVPLLVGLEVVRCVQEDEGEADDGRYAAEYGGQEEAQVVEGEAFP